MPKLKYGKVRFEEQIEFYKRKIPTPTLSWTDVYSAEHDYAAVVAGAHKREIIEDFASAINDFIENGKTLEQFRQTFDEIVARHGWQYNGGRNWRTRIIYETNLRSSYQAGRYAQLNEMRDTLPYWEYVHSDEVARPRWEHLGWDGLILRNDDPWWQTHFPINAWGCKCSVIGRSQDYMDKHGLKPDRAPETEWEEKTIGIRSGNPRTVRVPKGIDPGFEHIPGAGRLESQTMPPLDDSGNVTRRVTYTPLREKISMPLPKARTLPAGKVLPADLTDEEYISHFLREFGASNSASVIFKDVLGESLVIGPRLFTSRSGHSKLRKRERAKYILLLAEALKKPDEIWARVEHYHDLNITTVRRRYISKFVIEGKNGEVTPTLAVFETGKEGWDGVTNFVADKDEYLEQVRTGILLYRRKDE